MSKPTYTPGFKLRKDFRVTLNDKSRVTVRKAKCYLSISVDAHRHDVEDSHGLLGDLFTGKHLGRDGHIIQGWAEFGMEWQALPKDPKLVREDRQPQLTSISRATKARRRLASVAQDNGLFQPARVACAHAGTDHLIAECIQDEILTGDLDAAEAFKKRI